MQDHPVGYRVASLSNMEAKHIQNQLTKRFNNFCGFNSRKSFSRKCAGISSVGKHEMARIKTCVMVWLLLISQLKQRSVPDFNGKDIAMMIRFIVASWWLFHIRYDVSPWTNFGWICCFEYSMVIFFVCVLYRTGVMKWFDQAHRWLVCSANGYVINFTSYMISWNLF